MKNYKDILLIPGSTIREALKVIDSGAIKIGVGLGNSSSGLIDAPNFQKGTVNIGDRQKGRLQADSIINCAPMKTSILKAIQMLYSSDFQAELDKVKNPYGEGGASARVLTILKSANLEDLVKKSFYNL